MSYVKLTDENFEQEVLKSDIPVLVDFWAEWCVPCKMLGPVIEALAEEYAGKVKICKLDVDEAPDTAGSFSVQSIPTVMIFNNGAQVRQTLGAQPKETIVKLFSDLI
jgi:thioredoxin 1